MTRFRALKERVLSGRLILLLQEAYANFDHFRLCVFRIRRGVKCVGMPSSTQSKYSGHILLNRPNSFFAGDDNKIFVFVFADVVNADLSWLYECNCCLSLDVQKLMLGESLQVR